MVPGMARRTEGSLSLLTSAATMTGALNGRIINWNERNPSPAIHQTTRDLDGFAAVFARFAQPGIGQSGAAEAAIDYHVQSERDDTIGFLARGNRDGFQVERNHGASGAVQGTHACPARVV